jgi:4-amino-4-deoxy-L-arabinose transferase-like glycosyltransferase
VNDPPGTMSALPRRARGVPIAASLCGVVALMAGLAWSLVVPPFQGADEPQHTAYVQYLAETGEPPPGQAGLHARSEQQRLLMRALRYKQYKRHADPTAAGKRRVERVTHESSSPRSQGGYSYATSQPPLYYGLEALAYRASPSENLLDRLQLMRALSALLAALTAVLVFLFLRELLPATPWAWTLGSLAVALQPVLGNVAGGVNSDNLMYAAAAGVFLGLAVSFRRGLTPRSGIGIGACTAVGVLTKITMLALLPGIALGLVLLVLAAGPADRREAAKGALAAVATVVLPVVAYMVLNSTVWDRGLFLAASGSSGKPSASSGEAVTFTGFLDYLWQFYLPRLPFMTARFDHFPLLHIWYEGFVGRFSGGDYAFPGVVYAVAAPVYLGIAILAARALVFAREAVRRRLSEVATYAALALGLLLLIHYASYVGRIDLGRDFEQARYLFPLLALYGVVIALAARGAGGRWGPAVGVLLVGFAAAQSLLALLLTLTQYYG